MSNKEPFFLIHWVRPRISEAQFILLFYFQAMLVWVESSHSLAIYFLLNLPTKCTEKWSWALIVHAKEQEIEKRKSQVREKVQAQLNRVESEARSLDQLRRVSFPSPFHDAIFCSHWPHIQTNWNSGLFLVFFHGISKNLPFFDASR